MVTIALQLELLPFTSTTCNVTIFGPTSLQSKTSWETISVSIPHSSFDPASIILGLRIAIPETSRAIVTSWHIDWGRLISITSIVVAQVEAFP